MKRFGLIGERLEYSFSPSYFEAKFKQLGLSDYSYELFEMADIDEARALLHDDSICGLNVTIPYKESVIPLLDELSDDAKRIASVNTIVKIEGKAVGYNTDVIGFENSLIALIGSERPRALVFGSGGAARAVKFVLAKLEIEFQTVSRRGELNYGNIEAEHIAEHRLLINTTPVGTHPQVADKLPLPYPAVTKNHFAFDLIYNPDPTAFMRACATKGASVKSGLAMLADQADAAWKLWNR